MNWILKNKNIKIRIFGKLRDEKEKKENKNSEKRKNK